jgi:hypothetical protein
MLRSNFSRSFGSIVDLQEVAYLSRESIEHDKTSAPTRSENLFAIDGAD